MEVRHWTHDKYLCIPDLVAANSDGNSTLRLVVLFFAMESYLIIEDMVKKNFHEIKNPRARHRRFEEYFKEAGFDLEGFCGKYQSVGVLKSRQLIFNCYISDALENYFGIPSCLHDLANHGVDYQYGYERSCGDKIISGVAGMLYNYLGRLYPTELCIHFLLQEMLPFALDHQIEIQKPFGNFEKVLEYLKPEDQERSLYHLDVLR